MKRILCIIALAVLVTTAVPPCQAGQGPLLGAWEEVTTTGIYTPRSLAVSAIANGRLWIIGGVDAAGAVVGTVEDLRFLGNAWESRADMPTPRSNAAAVVVNNKIYVIGGYDADGNPSNAVEIFDPVAFTWTAKAPMPTARAGLVAVPYTRTTGTAPDQVVTQEIHVYGGDAGGTYPADHAYEIYTVDTKTGSGSAVEVDTWAPAPVMAPSAQVEPCGVAAKDLTGNATYLYMFGGYSGGAGPTPGAWRIDPADSSPQWDSNVHTMPEGLIRAGAVTVTASDPSGGTNAQYPMIIGGNTDRTGTYSAGVMVYQSGAYNGWLAGSAVAPDLPEPRGDRPAVCVTTGTAPYVWVVGGATTGGLATRVFRAPVNVGNYPPPPPVENSLIAGWEEMGADIPTLRDQTVFGAINGKLYVAGGFDSSGGVSGACEEYDPATNAWTSKAPMPVPVATAAGGVIDGKLYVAGGQSSTNAVESTLQIYDPASDSWTTGPPMPTARRNVAGAVSQGKFHVMAGWDGNDGNGMGTGEHETFDPAVGTWSSETIGCPWGMADAGATMVKIGDYEWIYFVGGWNWSTQLALSARWNAVTGGLYNGAWGQIASLPVGGDSGLTMAAITDLAGVQWPVAFGGSFGPIGNINKVFVYHDFDDPNLPNQWTADAALPFPRGGRPAVAQIGNYVYIAAGDGPAGRAPNTWRGLIGSGLPQDVATIGEAIAQPDGKKVNFTGTPTITRTYTTMLTQETYFWIEDADRSAALRVGPSTTSVMPGNKITSLSGTMTTDSATGCRTLVPTAMAVDPASYAVPAAVGMAQKSFLGGTSGSQPGRPGGTGLNNMGIVAKIWGTVTLGTQYYTGYDMGCYFYTDDGSGLLDGTDTGGVPNVGVRVYVSPGMPAVTTGQSVAARGIVGSEKVNGQMIPALFSDDFLYFYPADVRLF